MGIERVSPRQARAGIAAAVAAFVLCLALFSWSGRDAGSATPRIGAAAPPWQAVDLHGQTVSSQLHGGKVTVLFFTSARSPAAHLHAPRVRELAKRYRDDPRFQFLAIYSGVTCPVELGEIRVEDRILGQPFITVVDAAGELADRFGNPPLLSYFVIDGDGLIRHRGSFENGSADSSCAASACEQVLQALTADQDSVVSVSTELDW